ncbi:MAG: hypothetical protein U0572_11565 [Phycisphaerales bacterium]
MSATPNSTATSDPVAAGDPLTQLRGGRAPCLRCGYDRRGVADPSVPCPECGAMPPPSLSLVVRGYPHSTGTLAWSVVLTAFIVFAGVAATSKTVFALVPILISLAAALGMALLGAGVTWLARRSSLRSKRGMTPIGFSVSGVTQQAGKVRMRRSWRDVRAVVVRRRTIRLLHRRRWWPGIAFETTLDEPTLRLVGEDIDRMRRLAEQHPGASPRTLHIGRIRRCPRCGAFASDLSAPACQVCGIVSLKPSDRMVHGRSSPHSAARSAVRLALISAMFFTIAAALVILAFRDRVLVLVALGLVPMLVFPAWRLAHVAFVVARRRGEWFDRVWVIRSPRVEVADPGGTTSIPWDHLRTFDDSFASGDFKRWRLVQRETDAPPIDLWIDARDATVTDVVALIRSRLSQAAGAPPTQPPSA